MVEHKDTGVVQYIVSAHTRAEVAGSFGFLMKNYRIIQLSCLGLSRLLGCELPMGVAPGSFAEGDIQFCQRGKFFVLRIVD